MDDVSDYPDLTESDDSDSNSDDSDVDVDDPMEGSSVDPMHTIQYDGTWSTETDHIPEAPSHASVSSAVPYREDVQHLPRRHGFSKNAEVTWHNLVGTSLS